MVQDYTKSPDDLYLLATTFEAAESKALQLIVKLVWHQLTMGRIQNLDPEQNYSRREHSLLKQANSFLKNRFVHVPVVGKIMFGNHVDFIVPSV